MNKTNQYSKGFFQCKNTNWTKDKSCTNDVEYDTTEELKDTKCAKCGVNYRFVGGGYRIFFGDFGDLK